MGWSVLTPDLNRIKQFKEIVQATVDYIKETNDQMPAYKGWSEDYAKIIEYLSDMLVYDIANNTGYFKFLTQATENQRKKYCTDICETIDRICKGIKTKQKEIEKRIV